METSDLEEKFQDKKVKNIKKYQKYLIINRKVKMEKHSKLVQTKIYLTIFRLFLHKTFKMKEK